MKSIRWKLVFMYLSLVFMVLILTGTYIVISTENREKNKAKEELRQCAVYINEQVVEQYDSRYFQNSLVNLSIVSSSLKNVTGHILDNKGNTIASSTARDENSFQKYNDSAIITALNGEESFQDKGRAVDANEQVTRVMSYAYPVTDDGGQVEYVIYVQMDAESFYTSINQTIRTILISVVIAIVFTIILGFLFANTITKPISVLTKKANMMAKGHLEQKVSVKGNDEIGQLTRSFNTMAKELRKTVAEIDEQRNRLEIILMNMTDGVMAFDERGQLIHVNTAAYDMLEIDDLNISFKWLLKKLGLKLKDIKQDSIYEMTVNENGKYISTSIISYSVKHDYNSFIVVLHDVTKHRQLDDMRKEFVANVSHEIGTPLTTIKGYSELLLDGAIDDKSVAMDFLKEINVAADRMKLLRDDLLDLSRFDTRVNKFNKERTDLVEIARGCIRQNKVVAEGREQKIVFDDPLIPMYIYADVARVNQVITNIISNAMKYSDKGSVIKISMGATRSVYMLSISDNGIGMSKEELEENLGTIAKSGSSLFKEEMTKKDNIDIIGQFGVGFYSSFMVASKVSVLSRKFDSDKAYLWESTGVDGYQIKEATKDTIGTIITLTLKEGSEYDSFLEEYKLRSIVKKYSDYISYPITMMITHEHKKEGSEESVLEKDALEKDRQAITVNIPATEHPSIFFLVILFPFIWM